MVKRIIGIVFLVLGIGFYVFGNYVASEVADGRKKISSGQKSVDDVQSLSKLTPFTKGIGKAATGSAQKKIDKGREDVRKYQILADWMHGVGIGVFVIGAGLLAYSFIFKKRN
ncbi:hypothetical protein COB11_00650 [Candidatus Aerophobetes bacterium]|uniref:Uncharacterized protein n=1 Tax=Aerophobetes bacterium TaxID=2030807 RepID=A0A2A4YM53_UNCAE|nr:MAG: hypothetical protein COB11_00650 [Candidatus Aerophobetes bacterium]